MGKAQSKRSIDITTDPKKIGEGDEVAGKVEKIEDVDQKVGDAAAAVNGDAATPKETAEGEKKQTEESSENDKDLTTEKSAAEAKSDGAAGGEPAAETPKDEAAPSSPKDVSGEEISPLADESIKSKSKKDKVKKKWSFRSISFGKKDKQKPAKTEEPAAAAASAEAAAAAAATTNGEAEQNAAAAGQTSDAVASATTETKPTENGAASEEEQQLNGEKKTPATTTPTEEAVKSSVTAAPVAVENAKIEAATTETAAVKDEPVAEPVVAAVAAPAAVVTNGNGDVAAVEVLTNGDKNGLAESPVLESKEAAGNIPSNNDVDEQQPHQNGTNGDSATPPPTPVAVVDAEAEQIKNKSQIEVMQTDTANAHNNNTVNTTTTATKTATTTTTTENITESTENTEIAAAAELVQTQTTTIQNNTTNNDTTNTNTTTTPTTTINDNSINLHTSEAQNEVKVAEEEQVVAAIMAAVSSEPDAEGFVVVAPESETVSNAEPTVDSTAEPTAALVDGVGDATATVVDDVVVVESNQPPPPLPQSPPPSRVSAFALTDESTTPEQNVDIEPETTAITSNNDESIIEQTSQELEQQRADIEEQAHVIVAEITEKAVEILEEQQHLQQQYAVPESDTVANADSTAESTAEPSGALGDAVATVTDDIVAAFVEINATKNDVDDDDDEAVVEVDVVVSKDIDVAAIESDLEQRLEAVIVEEQPKILLTLSRVEQEEIQNASDNDNNDNVNGDDDDDVANDIEFERNNKDIAKDLKEKNAAADVTTQELPVTCE